MSLRRCPQPQGGLFLDSKQGILNGGDTGPVIVPGNPSESRLIEAIHHNGKFKMPPKRKLPERVIANFSNGSLWGAPTLAWPTAAAW